MRERKDIAEHSNVKRGEEGFAVIGYRGKVSQWGEVMITSNYRIKQSASAINRQT